MFIKNINSIGKIKALICYVADRLYCVKKFMMMDPDRFLSASLAKMEYPIVLLEKPTKTPTADGQFYNWESAIVVLQYSDRITEGFQGEDDAYVLTETILEEIQSYLTMGIEEADHQRPCGTTINFGQSRTVCDLSCGFGWRSRISWKSARKKCASKCNVKPDPCPQLCAEFGFKVFEDEDNNLCLELKSKSRAAESLIWTIKRCGKQIHDSKELDLKLGAEMFFDESEQCNVPIEIILKACSKDSEGNECCKFARIVLQPCHSEGCSLPWCELDCTDNDTELNPGGE